MKKNEATARNLPKEPETGSLPDDQETGLPLLHSWSGVYLTVFGCFLFWVGLLYLLSVSFL